MRQECKNSKVARTRTPRPCGSATSTSRRTRRGDARRCARGTPRIADVAWAHGSLITPPTPPEPPGIDDGTAAAVLDEAEAIINSVGASVLADVRAQQQRVRFGRIKRMFGRKRSS